MVKAPTKIPIYMAGRKYAANLVRDAISRPNGFAARMRMDFLKTAANKKPTERDPAVAQREVAVRMCNGLFGASERARLQNL